MKKFKYRISKKAAVDLENIWKYTFEKWSLDQADRYYNLIIDEIEFIARNIYGGKTIEHIKPGYRATIVKSHIVFYRIINDDTVEIIRILQQMIDIENTLNE